MNDAKPRQDVHLDDVVTTVHDRRMPAGARYFRRAQGGSLLGWPAVRPCLRDDSRSQSPWTRGLRDAAPVRPVGRAKA